MTKKKYNIGIYSLSFGVNSEELLSFIKETSNKLGLPIATTIKFILNEYKNQKESNKEKKEVDFDD